MVHMDMGMHGDAWGGPARQTPTTQMCTVVNNGNHHTTDHRTPHTCMRNPSARPSTPTTGPPWECPATHHIHAIQHTCNAIRPPLSCTRSEGCALKGKQPPTGTGHRPTHTTHNMATCSGHHTLARASPVSMEAMRRRVEKVSVPNPKLQQF